MTAQTGQPDAAWRTLSLVNDWIRHAEAKASLTLAADGVVGTLLYNLATGQAKYGVVLQACIALCSVLAFASGLLAAASLWPRLRRRGAPTNALYFDHIARSNPDVTAYVEHLQSIVADDDKLVRQIAAQVWANSRVARRKFALTGLALVGLILATVALALTALATALPSSLIP
jgi:hypothetical protein